MTDENRAKSKPQPAEHVQRQSIDPMCEVPKASDRERFQNACTSLRGQLREIEMLVRNMSGHAFFDGEQAFAGQHGEVRDQLTLAVRLLEDARMRLGKSIQYSEDGVSCYDKKEKEKSS